MFALLTKLLAQARWVFALDVLSFEEEETWKGHTLLLSSRSEVSKSSNAERGTSRHCFWQISITSKYLNGLLSSVSSALALQACQRCPREFEHLFTYSRCSAAAQPPNFPFYSVLIWFVG